MIILVQKNSDENRIFENSEVRPIVKNHTVNDLLAVYMITLEFDCFSKISVVIVRLVPRYFAAGFVVVSNIDAARQYSKSYHNIDKYH